MGGSSCPFLQEVPPWGLTEAYVLGLQALQPGFSYSIIERDARLEHRVATPVFVLLFFRFYLHFMHTLVCV